MVESLARLQPPVHLIHLHPGLMHHLASYIVFILHQVRTGKLATDHHIDTMTCVIRSTRVSIIGECHRASLTLDTPHLALHPPLRHQYNFLNNNSHSQCVELIP